jgi:DnaK suppressor protein
MTKRAKKPRVAMLRQLLEHERSAVMARVKQYRSAQEQEALPPPGDELDAARALSDVETHASLIERAEARLRAIDFAFNLIEQGRYGICAVCGEEIPLERLKALPFATYCVDCQQKRNDARRVGEGTVDEPFAHQWDLPEAMTEPTELSHDEYIKVPEQAPGEEEES